MRNASHTYSTTGYHSVNLTVTGSDGYTETVSKTGYISIEIPTIEIVLTSGLPDSSTQPTETIIPTQSITHAQSISRYNSGLQAQSLPITESVPQGLSRYPVNSIPQDISSQNGLSADDSINVKQPSINWSIKRGNNDFDSAFWMMIHTLEPWTVQVVDQLNDNKLVYPGQMVEYDYNKTPPGYVSGGKYLHNALQLQSKSSNGTLSPIPV